MLRFEGSDRYRWRIDEIDDRRLIRTVQYESSMQATKATEIDWLTRVKIVESSRPSRTTHSYSLLALLTPERDGQTCGAQR